MILTKQIGSLTEISSTGGFVHKLGTDTYAPTIIMLPADTLDMYEEAAEIPAYTKEQYSTEVERLIACRYSTGQEIQLLAEKDSNLEAYNDYREYVENCKQRAKVNLATKNA